MTESVPFKAYYGQNLAVDLADRVCAAHPAFPADSFLAFTGARIESLELKARVALIAEGLRRYLPPDYPEALRILLAILPPPMQDADGMFNQGHWVLPLATFVEVYGLEHFEESIAALYQITMRFSSEFAVRPFLVLYPARTLARLRGWLDDPNPHVRRWISEGTRTRLPWGAQLKAFIADPTPTLALIEHLKDDPSLYVRKSVANHLNDVTKDHPALVLETLARWNADPGASEGRRWIVRHALRTLVKKGDARALALLGYSPGEHSASIQADSLEVSPAQVRIGDEITLRLVLTNTGETPVSAVVDYRVHHVRANGKASPKVFKWKSLELAPGESATLTKKHSLRIVTTRRLYPGPHEVDVQVNGLVLGKTSFVLEG